MCTLFVDELCRVFTNHGSQYRRHPSGEGSGGTGHDIDASAEPAGKEDAEDCERKCDTDEHETDAIDYRHDARDGLQRAHTTADFSRPA